MALLTCLISLLLATPAQPQNNPLADLVVHNARIWTADPQRPAAQWLAVREGALVALGDGEGWTAHRGQDTLALDAEGRRVLPGLIDAHVHLGNAANDMRTLDLRPAASRQELLDMLRRHAATLPGGAWLVGTRWSSESWPDQRPPNADEIDEATAGRPAVLVRMDGHSLIASRSALEAAGITKDSPEDPPGGTIGRDADGEPTGAVYEQAMGLVNRHIVQPEADEQALLERGVAEANRNGITSVGAIEGRNTIEALADLEEAGKLPLRVYVSLSRAGDTVEEWNAAMEWAVAHRGWRRAGDDRSNEGAGDTGEARVRIIGFKGYMDGSLGSRTAWMTRPYEDNHLATDKAPDNAGFPLAMAANGELEKLIQHGAKLGLQPAVHAIGDQANHVLLNWYAQLPEEQRRALRPRIEHAQHLLPEDMKRFGELGMIASMQPYHKADDGRYAEQRIGPQRIRSSYAFRGLLDSGATLAFGSDWPVVSVNPFLGIHAAVTAKTLDGKTFVPEQSISVEEALVAYTRGSAAALLDERIGVLKPGALADLVILDRDVLSIPPAEIPQTQVEATFVAGKRVYQREGGR